jgi:nucleoside-diphosphate-sugar epimerase
VRRLLVTGGAGYLGTELVRRGAVEGWAVRATWWTRPAGLGAEWVHADVRDEHAIRRAASGADVVVRGRRTGDRAIEVSGYEVRTVDGVTAITGTLTAEGDRLVLVTDAGRRYPIARPPAPLREHVGARVWVTGDPATTIGSYGVLRPKR